MAKEEMIAVPGIGPTDDEVRQAHSDAIRKSVGAVRYGVANTDDAKPASAHVAATPMTAGLAMGTKLDRRRPEDF